MSHNPQNTNNKILPSENQKKWLSLSENLTVFISAAENLICSLQVVVDSLKSESNEVDEDFLCACATLSENIKTFTSKENVPVIKLDSQPAKVEENMQEPEDCTCESNEEEKTPLDEKMQKFLKLKEDMAAAHANLSCIQEQIRQLERLYEDYDSFNTKEGQVNVAALYKEIMKPQTVPFVIANNSLMRTQVSLNIPTNSVPAYSKASLKGKTSSKTQSCPSNLQNKVSVLFAVPLDSKFC